MAKTLLKLSEDYALGDLEESGMGYYLLEASLELEEEESSTPVVIGGDRLVVPRPTPSTLGRRPGHCPDSARRATLWR
jgi:hypothetical protein